MVKSIAILIIGIVIAGLGYFLQLQKYEHFPPTGDTFDELKGVFTGVNLIKTGIPRSWSWFTEYRNFSIENFRNSDLRINTDLRIVEPYFDDPPLFALISGYYAISKGMDSLEKIDAGVMRWPMLKLGFLNIFLLFLLVHFLKGFIEASLSALIYATVPTMVLGARLPIADNGIVTFALLSLVLFTFYIKKKWFPILVLASVVASSAFLMKSTGIFIPVVLILFSLLQRNYKAVFTIGIFAIVSIGIWLGYGYYYNWELFTKLISIYSGRELFSPSQIINLFTVYRIGEKSMSVDGWILWGWISVVLYSLIKNKDEALLPKIVLPVTVGAYLVFFSIMSGHSKGWYRFPFYPFISWACASVFLHIVKNPRFLLTMFFIAIPVSSSYIYGTGEDKWNQDQRKIYQIFFPLLMVAPMLYELFQNQKLRTITQIILILGFTFAIIFNIRTILFYQDQYWY